MPAAGASRTQGTTTAERPADRPSEVEDERHADAPVEAGTEAESTGRGPVDSRAPRLVRARQRVLGLGSPLADEALDGPARSRGPAILLFAVAACTYVVHQLLTRGQMLLGSMWAEMATNYYAETTREPWYAQLLATDAGYIPLPQRGIALVGDALGLPPQAISWFYTCTALVLSAMMIGSFCLAAFRPVINSDLLRFATSLAIMLVPDFETRTFINFTYFTVVVAGFVTALALVDRDHEVPVWAWVLPVLVISKPGVLTVLPAMVLVALVSRRRFRLVAGASVVAGMVQAVQLYLSSRGDDTLLQESEASLVDKGVATLKYSLGMLGRVVTGPLRTMDVNAWITWGVAALLLSLVAVALLRSRAGGLVLVGLSLLLFSMMVNSFTFSALFTPEMPMLGIASFDRRYVVAVVGGLFVVAGLIGSVVESGPPRRFLRPAPPSSRAPLRAAAAVGVVGFTGWFVLSGWIDYAAQINQLPPVPTSGMSQWQESAPLLTSGTDVVCIPLDPFGWSYGKNCDRLAGDPIDPATVSFPAVPEDAPGDPARLPIEVPAAVADGELGLFLVVVGPTRGDAVEATAVVTTADGEETRLHADTQVPPTGGAVTFTVPGGGVLTDVRKVDVEFQAPAQIASTNGQPSGALTMWMGRPSS